MEPIITISVLGSIASIVSVLISGPTVKSKLVHVSYALILTAVVGSSVLYTERVNQDKAALEQKLKEKDMLSKQAEHLLAKYKDGVYSDSGDYRGSILGALAFLEKHQNIVPDSYQRAKELAEGGLQIYATTPVIGQDKYDEEKRLRDGAKAMRILIESLAYPQN